MCGRQTALYSPQWDVSYVNEIFRIIFSFIICHVIILVVPAVSFLCVIPHRLKSVNQNSDSWLQPWPGLPALGLRAEQAAGLMKPSLTLSVQSLRFVTHALSNLTSLLCLFFLILQSSVTVFHLSCLLQKTISKKYSFHATFDIYSTIFKRDILFFNNHIQFTALATNTFKYLICFILHSEQEKTWRNNKNASRYSKYKTMWQTS